MTQSYISPITTTAPILLRKTPRRQNLVGVSHFLSVFPFKKVRKVPAKNTNSAHKNALEKFENALDWGPAPQPDVRM